MRALVTGSNGGIGSAIVGRRRHDGYDVMTMDMTEPADLLVDLQTDEVPADALSDIDVCVSNSDAVYITGQEIVVAGGGDVLQVSLGSSRRTAAG